MPSRCQAVREVASSRYSLVLVKAEMEGRFRKGVEYVHEFITERELKSKDRVSIWE